MKGHVGTEYLVILAVVMVVALVVVYLVNYGVATPTTTKLILMNGTKLNCSDFDTAPWRGLSWRGLYYCNGRVYNESEVFGARD